MTVDVRRPESSQWHFPVGLSDEPRIASVSFLTSKSAAETRVISFHPFLSWKNQTVIFGRNFRATYRILPRIYWTVAKRWWSNLDLLFQTWKVWARKQFAHLWMHRLSDCQIVCSASLKAHFCYALDTDTEMDRTLYLYSAFISVCFLKACVYTQTLGIKGAVFDSRAE